MFCLYTKNIRVLLQCNADNASARCHLCCGAYQRKIAIIKLQIAPCSSRIMHSRFRRALIKQIGSVPRIFHVLLRFCMRNSVPLRSLNCHNKLTRRDVTSVCVVASVRHECLRNCEVQYLQQHFHAPFGCIAVQRGDSRQSRWIDRFFFL